MISPYFSWETIRMAVKAYCKEAGLPSLMHFAVIADEFSELELEVVVAYIERQAGMSTPYPVLPDNYESLFEGF